MQWGIMRMPYRMFVQDVCRLSHTALYWEDLQELITDSEVRGDPKEMVEVDANFPPRFVDTHWNNLLLCT